MGGVYIGEELLCQRDEENRHDPYAVVVLKSATVVGHLPRKNIYTLLAVYSKGGAIRSQDIVASCSIPN